MGVRVFGDPRGGAVHECRRHPVRLLSPSLIRHLVHVAVVAGEIAPTVDLEHELAERRGTPAGGDEGIDVECGRPLGTGRPLVDCHPHQPAGDGAPCALIDLANYVRPDCPSSNIVLILTHLTGVWHLCPVARSQPFVPGAASTGREESLGCASPAAGRPDVMVAMVRTPSPAKNSVPVAKVANAMFP